MQRFPDANWISERRLKRDKCIEKGFCRRGHVPDGILLLPCNKKIAIEVELTMKGKDRVRKIIRNYALDSSIANVWYYCAPEIINKIRKITNRRPYVNIYDLSQLLT